MLCWEVDPLGSGRAFCCKDVVMSKARRSSRATFQWVTHPRIALAPNSLNFGVPMTPKSVSSQKASCQMEADISCTKDEKKNMLILVSFLVWEIWKSRCKAVIEGRIFKPIVVIEKALWPRLVNEKGGLGMRIQLLSHV
ncbi:hypothetical protein L3X38_021990 [Prunus dulcis]|uniref:Uncharacterized protein n=1 Tax=Prunus dulcis TaxID=3755 RepID=A0AAD4VWR3_PRUDU|nr:hypothetical protein L3X38_021990 [Prunus dulcis]